MCGIFGVINSSVPSSGKKSTTSYFNKARDFIEQGFITSGIRGLDSSGVFQVDTSATNFMHKLPVCGSLFIEDKATKAFLVDSGSSPLTVCHVRAATQGRVHINNAHPFQVWNKKGNKSIIGVHNGTIGGWQRKAGSDSSKYSVDSEWLLAHIAEEGADAFEDFGDGSFSLVWIDTDQPGKVMFARNKDRPMHFVRTKDKKHVLFASEAGMLTWLAERNDIDIEDKVYSSADDRMYCVDFTQPELVWKDLGQYPAPKSVVVRSAGSSKTTYYGNPNWDDDGWESGWDYSRSDKERRASTIQGILAALKEARDGTKSEKKTTDEDTETVLEGDYIQTADSSWFSDTLSTYAEKEHAKNSNWYGDVVEFDAVEFDNETCEVVGDVLDVLEEGVLYSGVIRNLSRTDYENNYKDKSSYAVIIGSRDTHRDGTEFILSPLTDVGLKEVTRIYTE